MAPFVKQFLRLDGNFLQKRRKSAAADARPPHGKRPAAPESAVELPAGAGTPGRAPPGSPRAFADFRW